MLQKASMMKVRPTIKAEKPSLILLETRKVKNNTTRLTEPRTKFGIVFAAVDRIFVPNCSAAIVTKMAQYPVEAPSEKQ